MPHSSLLLFVHAVSKYCRPCFQRISLARPDQPLSFHSSRRVRVGSLRMSSEISDDSPSVCKNPSYGASDRFPVEDSSHVPSPSANAPTAYPRGGSPEKDFRLLSVFVFLAISLVLGSLTAATGFLSPDTLVQIAKWFERLGPSAIYLYSVLYFILELVAVPALPLTLGSGYLFGLVDGTIAVSIASTVAATVSFLVARYGLRGSVSRLADNSTSFRIIDRAIAREGFKFVLLLRLSPLLPFAISNYLYGLTSVKLGDYIIGSWLGMLPGTIAYVSAGAAVSTLTDLQEGQTAASPGLVITGLVATVAVLTIIGKVAREAIENVEEEEMPQH